MYDFEKADYSGMSLSRENCNSFSGPLEFAMQPQLRSFVRLSKQ